MILFGRRMGFLGHETEVDGVIRATAALFSLWNMNRVLLRPLPRLPEGMTWDTTWVENPSGAPNHGDQGPDWQARSCFSGSPGKVGV